MFALDPIAEYEIVSTWTRKLVNLPISAQSLSRRMGIFLSQRHPISVKLHQGSAHGLELGEFAIGAAYCPASDLANCKHFNFDLIINYNDVQRLTFSSDNANRLALELVEALVHEYEHRQQYRQRNYKTHQHKYTSQGLKSTVQEQYLSDPDEIQAYAGNIAARLFLLNIDLNTVTNNDSLDLNQYFQVFGKSHPVTQQLLTTIQQKISYLEGSKNGQDYKNARAAA